MKYFIILSAMLMIHFSLLQSGNKVIDVAAQNALVASAHPIKDIKLDAKDMELYVENLMDYSDKVLDTVMFSEIIKNAASPDTSTWKEEELKNLLVVNTRDEAISKKYLIEKLNLAGKKQMRYYTRHINRYNETDPNDRNIYFFSKPVYSNSGRYAVVQWDNGNKDFTGGGGINLYHLEGKEWAEVGVISRWKY